MLKSIIKKGNYNLEFNNENDKIRMYSFDKIKMYK